MPSLSIARNQSWFELGRPLLCVLAISCGFLVGADAGRARQLIKVIAWSGAAYAAYGILSRLFDPTHILWREKEAYLESVTGTFINRNTAGAYFGSCAVLWSLLLWERARLERPRGPLDWWAMFSHLFSAPPKKVVVTFAMLFLCLTAMFMTLSRGAVAVSLLALGVAFAAFFRRDLPSRAGLVTALAGGGAVALVLLQFMGAGVNARFDVQGLGDEGRLETYKATLRMIADHPWFGTGQGTFAYAFPAYRSSNVSVWGVLGYGAQYSPTDRRRHGCADRRTRRHSLDRDFRCPRPRHTCPQARSGSPGRRACRRHAGCIAFANRF